VCLCVCACVCVRMRVRVHVRVRVRVCAHAVAYGVCLYSHIITRFRLCVYSPLKVACLDFVEQQFRCAVAYCVCLYSHIITVCPLCLYSPLKVACLDFVEASSPAVLVCSCLLCVSRLTYHNSLSFVSVLTFESCLS
jgi:hypothetical protein